MTIAKLDRPTIISLRSELSEALAKIGEKHGIAVRLGNCKFTEDNATFKLEVATRANTGEVMSKDAVAFKSHAVLFGVKPEDLGRTFAFNGRNFTLTGLNPRRPKFPFSATCKEDGKSYKLPKAGVVSALGR